MRIAGQLLFPDLGLQELGIHIGSINANEFATSIYEARRRQEQKESLEIETLDGTFEGKQGGGVRYGLKQAIAMPRHVDGHAAGITPGRTSRDPVPFSFRSFSQLSVRGNRAGTKTPISTQKIEHLPLCNRSWLEPNSPFILAPGQIRVRPCVLTQGELRTTAIGATPVPHLRRQASFPGKSVRRVKFPLIAAAQHKPAKNAEL
jgi:hypothetical protein